MSDDRRQIECISRSLSGMRYAASQQEDEGVRLVCDIEAGIIWKALAALAAGEPEAPEAFVEGPCGACEDAGCDVCGGEPEAPPDPGVHRITFHDDGTISEATTPEAPPEPERPEPVTWGGRNFRALAERAAPPTTPAEPTCPDGPGPCIDGPCHPSCLAAAPEATTPGRER